MHLASLDATDFRNITETSIEPDPVGATVITGLNGAGKSSLLEAIAYLGTLASFRSAPRETMVRRGCDRAILRAETRAGDRHFTIEAEIPVAGQARTMVNRQVVRRRSDLRDALRTTVFSPEDIAVVRDGPAARRQFLDATLELLDPRAARASEDVEKILRQRTALLRNAARKLTEDVVTTLDIWDGRLVEAGTVLVDAREALVAELEPIAEANYGQLAGARTLVNLAYRRSWEGGLAEALERSRARDVERAVTQVGPHRDELDLGVRGLPARSQASQGEQRSLALALRLAAHQLITERLGSPPVLLLDDVFSELDPFRSRALLAGLPAGQALVTTALPVPTELAVAKTYTIEAGGEVVATTPRTMPR